MEKDLEETTQRFLEMLTVSGSLKSEAVAEALRDVPRHLFVDQFYDTSGSKPRLVKVSTKGPTNKQLERIYADSALVSHRNRYGATSSISAPSLVVQMLEQLQLTPGMKVLEIGAGTGWNAALIGHIVGSNGQVTSIDIQSDFTRRARKHIKKLGAKNVEIITCDGMQGWKIQSPYDRIVTTVNSPDISPHWINQLKTNGRMLVSLHDVVGEGRGLLVRLKKAKNHLHGEVVGLAGFLIMDGEYGQSFTPREEKIQEASQGRRAQRKVSVWKNWPKEVRRGRVRDLLFYAQLEGLSVESGGNYRRGTAIVRKPGDESACVVETDDINVYGGDGAWQELMASYRKWVTLGAPSRMAYTIDVCPRQTLKNRPKGGWLLKRENSVLSVRLKKGFAQGNRWFGIADYEISV